ncbi:beta-3-deoxy-D-manno-oct-2-ulosonic acid transferase [Sphingomonas sp. GlSt437]|uniref:capsular polysaccharide export protein, LipB/KpsS family n=1 Tax=Sphingomonas sp. GlSt437 TaxID=3389970 RepID=UPI003A8C54BE
MTGDGRFSDCASSAALPVEELVSRHLLTGIAYCCPFTGAPSSGEAAIQQLGEWRALIERNRRLGAVIGIAGWKRTTVTPLLWDGADGPRYARRVPAKSNRLVGIWKSRAPKSALAALAANGQPTAEIEDGFIRSTGLGADCVPPLSIIVDERGIYFDPAGPSDLEDILRDAAFDGALLERAESLRQAIVKGGISKYAASTRTLPRPAGPRRTVLVPGQVEDDRSVLNGGGEVRSNLDLLRRARAEEPDAYLIFKPHPDVEAGHRAGHVPVRAALSLADDIVRDTPMSALLDMVDAVHVLTSLAGFEALMRGKEVITHGTPFYAGWGLTSDRAPIPPRRGQIRSITELIAGTLVLYPRYLDFVTRLPCGPEIAIRRISEGLGENHSLLVQARRVQGRVTKALKRLA